MFIHIFIQEITEVKPQAPFSFQKSKIFPDHFLWSMESMVSPRSIFKRHPGVTSQAPLQRESKPRLLRVILHAHCFGVPIACPVGSALQIRNGKWQKGGAPPVISKSMENMGNMEISPVSHGFIWINKSHSLVRYMDLKIIVKLDFCSPT